jgi:signal transduction histidine kinase
VRGAFLRGVLAAALLALLGSSSASAQIRHVLVLKTFDRGSVVFDRFTTDFRRELERRAAARVTFTEFAIAPAGIVEAPEEQIVSFLVGMFASRSSPDLVVTVGGPAATFVRRNRNRLFLQTPTMFAAVEQRFLAGQPLSDSETTVPVAIDYPLLVDDVLRLLPGTTHVFVVMGSNPLSRFWRAELERNFRQFDGRVTFSWSDGLTFEQMISRAEQLPPRSAILYMFFGTDVEGRWRSDEQALAALSQRANAPVFGVHEALLGMGIVGGRLLSIPELGETAGDVAARILAGESPESTRVAPQRQGHGLYDSRQLRRWNIPESRLPPGSEIRLRPPSVWQEYRREVLGVLGLVTLQSLLIVGLLYQRHARRKAEVESRRNLSLAADASRRLTMSALTGSIAHDLSQPLSSIELNAHAGQMLVTSNRATVDGLQAIFSDIREANVRASEIVDRHRSMLEKHQLETRPLDIHVVVRESMALVAHDTRARHVEARVDLPPMPCVVAGDRVLLQQVLVNLLINAMDAMADVPTDRRRLRVASEVGPATVRILVRDSGPGLPEPLDGEIFEPFRTTKAHGIGIGLTIARNIVDAHRGTLDARNNPDAGATFRMTLPRSDMTQGR